MKRSFTFVLSATMALSLAACGNANNNREDAAANAPKNNTEAAAATTTTPSDKKVSITFQNIILALRATRWLSLHRNMRIDAHAGKKKLTGYWLGTTADTTANVAALCTLKTHSVNRNSCLIALTTTIVTVSRAAVFTGISARFVIRSRDRGMNIVFRY